MSAPSDGQRAFLRRRPLVSILVVLLALEALVLGVGRLDRSDDQDPAGSSVTAADSGGQQPSEVPSAEPPPVPKLPFGRDRVFDGRFLVAYYGSPQTSALGVLGEDPAQRMTDRLRVAAKPFRRPDQKPQLVYEIIVTVVDGGPGKDGDWSHDIPKRLVRQYIRAAHRNNALVLLDIQTGRSDFLKVAKRWSWALKDPWVGLALDPEWRMGPHQIPARVIGQVKAAEVNRTSAWLSEFTARHRLPEKLFVLHTFRREMLQNVRRIRDRENLAEVMHVDGFGPPAAKLGTYRHVARPEQFTMGFKLFYDEDVPRMSARQVLQINPRVDFVSFQ